MKKTINFTVLMLLSSLIFQPTSFSAIKGDPNDVTATALLDQKNEQDSLPSNEANSEIKEPNIDNPVIPDISQEPDPLKEIDQNKKTEAIKGAQQVMPVNINLLTSADFTFDGGQIMTTIKKNKDNLPIEDLPLFDDLAAIDAFLYWQDSTTQRTYTYDTLRSLVTTKDLTLEAVFKEEDEWDKPFYGMSDIPTPPDSSKIKAMPHIFHDPVTGSGNVGPEFSSDFKTLLITPQKANSKDKSALGAIWSKKKLNINKSFSFKAYIYLGNAKKKAGDGMTFTMHNDPREGKALGSDGSGIGAYSGNGGNQTNWVKNALSIEFDTYYNSGKPHNMDSELNKNGEKGHVAFVTPSASNGANNGKGQHSSVYYPGDFLSNGKWRRLIVTWDAQAKKLTYEIAGETVKSYAVANPQQKFGGDFVYWGFTGSTGGNSSDNAVVVTDVPNTITNEASIKNQSIGEADYSNKTTARPKATLSLKDHIILDDSSPIFGNDATVSIDLHDLTYKEDTLVVNNRAVPAKNITYEGDLLTISLDQLTTDNEQEATITFDATVTNPKVDTQYQYDFTYIEDGVLSDSTSVSVVVPYLTYKTFNIHYLNLKTNEVIQPSTSHTEVVGDPYETQPIDIEGYVMIKDSGNTAGTITADMKDITYYYQPGILTLKEVPQTFDFKNHPISNKTETYWPEIKGKLTVTDDRGPQAKTWRLTLNESQPLTDSTTKQTLNDLFKWADGDVIQPVTGHELLIKELKQDGDITLSDDWSKEQQTGLHITAPVEKQLKGNYTGALTWHLIDAP